MTGNGPRYPRISKQSTEDAKAVNLITLAQSMGLDMNRSGKQFFMHCPNPDHHETNMDNFAVEPIKHTFHCFSCGIGGKDAITFHHWHKYGKAPYYKNDQDKWKAYPTFFDSMFEVAKLVGLEMKDEDGNVLVQNGGYDASKSTYKSRELTPQPVDVVNQVYRTFLSLCTLRKDHADELLNRGYTMEDIKLYQFKSVPTQQEWARIYAILHQNRYPFERVPGFSQVFVPNNFNSPIPREIGEEGTFKDEKGIIHQGHWFYVPSAQSGYFIPVFNVYGQIERLRVRKDKGTPKYIWFSSSHNIEMQQSLRTVRRNGASSGAPLTVAVPKMVLARWNKGAHVSDIMHTQTILATEGEHSATRSLINVA